ncbi:MAG TPA: S8 family serine peptidase [Burkholderiales bacterium]|nr:S8 family serine peptidase [Burkholderiales bacterium]
MPERPALSANIAPNEIVFSTASIALESRYPLDRDTAQGGVVVKGVRGRVRLSRGGRMATWSADKRLPPGHHTLVVDGLISKDHRRRIGDRMEIPFFVTDSKATVARTVRVESMSRLRVNDLATERLPADRSPGGRFIEVMKAAHRTTGAPIRLAFDQSGRRIDPDAILARIAKNRARRFGKLHESLYARLEKLGASARIPVAIWLRCDEALEPAKKKERGETKTPPRQALVRDKAIAKVVRDFAPRLEKEYRVRGHRADPAAPVVYASLTREQVKAIAGRPEVAGLFFHETEGIEDLADSIAIANSDDVHTQGFKASGVKVAIWENAPDVTTNLSITARFKSSGLTLSDHSRHTHGIVKNIEANKPHGHAPSCSLHSANTKDLDALRWAAKDRGCTVISQSFHRSSEPESGSLSYDDIYKDWLILQWPYPTICQAAGNYWNGDPDDIDPPEDEYVNHKGYNSLAVGNHNDTAGAMSGDSVFRNPSTSHGDRELPEIAANGTGVTTVGLTKSGTSMASPAAAGCAALIQNVDGTLKSWPEGCRAILLAAAKRNVSGNNWWQDVVANVDASDGSGAVDALEAVAIAKQRRSRNATATARGWDVGTLRSSDIGANKRTTFSYSVKLGSTFFSPRHVKVALAWDSKITMLPFPFGIEVPIASTLTVDLDLQIFDSRGVQVGYSGSWDNSYEIAEFDGKPGETYTIKIRRWSGTDSVWYGIGWTVTGGLRWADVTRGTVLQEAIARR